MPEHNPLLLAKQVATLDHLSGGRFIFGIGAGGRKEESEIMGSDFPHRWTQTRDAVLAMKELWTKEESEYHGTYYDFPPVRSFPSRSKSPTRRYFWEAWRAMPLNESLNMGTAGCLPEPPESLSLKIKTSLTSMTSNEAGKPERSGSKSGPEPRINPGRSLRWSRPV